MRLPKIIQGGMGVAVSNWKLARAVSSGGQLGVVSGTGIGLILVARLMKGDPGGHVRRALKHFPDQSAASKVLQLYFAEAGPARRAFKPPPMWRLKPPRALLELTVAASFVEVFLAKEGHANPVGMNLLEKVQLPTMPSLYGAMLAGVEVVLMGAGIPAQVPGLLDSLAQHQPASYRLDVAGGTCAATSTTDSSAATSTNGEASRTEFDPEDLFPGITERVGPLHRPAFMPIISSVALAKALIKRSTGTIEGFVVESPVAGGHNGPPRGPLNLNAAGEPVYGAKDTVNFQAIKDLGLPFYLAGGYDTPERLREAQAAGARGIQVGTAFAYCRESGLDDALKAQCIEEVLRGRAAVRTDALASPTGFPFKVVQLEGTLSDPLVYESRERVCDFGMLRQLYKRPDGRVGFRCPAEPTAQYLAKGGSLENTRGRVCLCNGLMAAAGHPHTRPDGYVEPPVVTAGNALHGIGKYLKPGHTSYAAQDVLDYLTSATIQRTV